MLGAPWTRRDTLLCVVVGIAALLTRAALRSTGLTSLDSGLLAVGVVDYDFASYRPHPPYYPLAIAFGKLAAAFVGPLQAFTWLAILASAVLAGATYAVARHFLGRAASTGAGLLVVLSPIALENGISPLSYALEGAASALVALFALRARRNPRPRTWLLLGVAASIAAGVRPSSLFLLVPLAFWGAGLRLRPLAWTAGAGMATSLAWGLPALAAGGDLATFLYGVRNQSEAFILAQTVFNDGWYAVSAHLETLRIHLRVEGAFLAFVALVSLVAGAALLPRLRGRALLPFLAAWALPGLAFYVLIYAGAPINPSGYLMGIAPAIFIACAAVLETLVRVARDPLLPRPQQVATLAVVGLVAVLPMGWPLEWEQALAGPRAAQAWGDQWHGMESVLPPESTALLTFYAPPWAELVHTDYLTWQIQPIYVNGGWTTQIEQGRGLNLTKKLIPDALDGPDPPHPIPPGIERIVVFDGHPMEGPVRIVHPSIPLERVQLPSGATALVFSTAGLTYIEDAAEWTPNP